MGPAPSLSGAQMFLALLLSCHTPLEPVERTVPQIEPGPPVAGVAEAAIDFPVGTPLGGYTGRCDCFGGSGTVEGEDGLPHLREDHACFSCYNCMVVCEYDAITIEESYHVKEGFFKTDPLPLPQKTPLPAQDEQGNTAEWNETERLVFERRSVRNFKSVPHLQWR